MKASRRENLLGYIVLVAMAVITLVPFASILLTAFHPPMALVSGLDWPKTWDFSSFTKAWTAASFGRLLISSSIVAVCVVPLAVICATLAGYALGLLGVPAGRVLFSFFLFGLTLPVELIVIPLYFDLRTVGLTNTYLGVILSECGLFMPFGVFWMRTHFQSTPRELIEAAELDGASRWMILRRVLLPLAGPPISTMAVLFFMWSWNQFLLVLILIQDPAKRTAPAGLGFFVGQFTSDLPTLCAGTLIVIFPIFVVYLIFQRKFISGMLSGAFK